MSAVIHLKCILCRTKDKRPASECTGDNNPACQKCFGPMIMEKVTVKK